MVPLYRFIRLYSFQSTGQQEKISFTVRWSRGLSYAGNFFLPESSECMNTFLEAIIQDDLESKLLYGLDFNLPLLRSFIDSPVFQMDYFYSLPDRNVQMERLLLLNAEGLQSDQFLQHEQVFLECLQQVHVEHPLLNHLNAMRNLRLRNQKIYTNRTRYFKEFIDKSVQTIFMDAVTFAYHDDEAGLNLMLRKLKDIYARIASEQNFPDERFTFFGKSLYKLFKQDSMIFPAQSTQLTNEEASEIFDRLDAVQGAGPVCEEQDERNLFYSCYAASLRNIYRLPEESRTHFKTSLETAKKLRSHNLSDPTIIHAINFYDPMAVHYPNYSNLVFEAINKPHRKRHNV